VEGDLRDQQGSGGADLQDRRLRHRGRPLRSRPAPHARVQTPPGEIGARSLQLELSDEQKMIQQVARDFAEKEVRPIAETIDRESRVPRETVARMGELGLMGIAVPESHGGSGGDTVAYALALEEVARACASHAVIMSVNNSLYCDSVMKYGTEEQKAGFLPPFASGQKIGCFALTEPEAGSDASNQHTLAGRDGDHYVLDGRKVFVTNGRESAAALVFAQTDRAAGHRGISAFL